MTPIRHDFPATSRVAEQWWLAPLQWTRRIHATGVDKVIADLHEVPDDGPATRALRRALEQSSHILRLHPEQAWFQVYNRTRAARNSEIDQMVGGPPKPVAYLPRFVSVRQIDARLMRTLFYLDGNHDMALSPDGETVVTDGRHDFLFWDLATGAVTKKMASGSGGPKYKRSILRVAWSPDGKYLAGGSLFADRNCVVWDLKSNERVPLSEEPVCCGFDLVFSPDSRTLTALGRSGSGRYRTYAVMYDLNSGTARELTEFESTIVTRICLIHENHHLLFGTGVGCSIFSVKTSRVEPVFETSKETNCVAFSPEANLIAATAIGDPQIRLWNAEDFTPVKTFDTGQDTAAAAVAFSPSGKELASIDFRGAVDLWNIASGEVRRVGQHESAGLGIEFTPDGESLLTAAEDHRIKVWDAGAREPVGIDWSHETVKVARISPDGRLLATGGNDGTVRMWDAKTGQGVAAVKRPGKRKPRVILDMAFSPDCSELCVVGHGKIIEVWDLQRFELKLRIDTAPNTFDRFQEPRVSKVIYSADGQSIFTAKGGIPRKYLAATGELQNEYVTSRVVESNTRSIAVAGNGSLLASLHTREIRLWDPSTGERKSAIAMDRYWTPRRDLHLAADGSIVAACIDGEVRIWTVATGKLVCQIPGDVMDLAQNGKRLITGSDDGSVRVWDVNSQTELHSFSIGQLIHSVELGKDGTLVVVENGGAVHLFDPVSKTGP